MTNSQSVEQDGIVAGNILIGDQTVLHASVLISAEHLLYSSKFVCIFVTAVLGGQTHS